MGENLRREDAPQVEGPPIAFTGKAVEMLKEVLERDGRKAGGLRVAVVGGGCSGFQCNLSFAEFACPDDEVVTRDGVKAFVDPISAQYLRGSTLDYVTGLYGAGFKLHNPQATRTFGCESSFSL